MGNPANPRRPREVRRLARDLDFADALRVIASSRQSWWPRMWWPSGTPSTRTSRCLRGARPHTTASAAARTDRTRGCPSRRAARPSRPARRSPRATAGNRGHPASARTRASASRTRSSSCSGGKYVRVTDATRRPMTEITDNCTSSASPLVVTVLCAHRTLTLATRRRDHDARISSRQAEYAVDGVLESQAPSCAVLRMLICLKSAAGHPCDTGAICPGCPLPQLNAPPSTYVDGPPTASIEFQKSVVRDW